MNEIVFIADALNYAGQIIISTNKFDISSHPSKTIIKNENYIENRLEYSDSFDLDKQPAFV